MASTYSPKLRFELIGAGEQPGLWGSTTNKNIGQLIEQAIAGVTTVELDGVTGNYTLTALDGAPDQSRSAVIKCTYAAAPAAGAINLIVPTQTKLYVVRNDCGQTVTVKTAAQTGGVQILDGESTLVFCDGTNAEAGIETAAVGTLTVSGGGTGTTTFGAGGILKSSGGTAALTASAVNLGSSDTTGTLPVSKGGTGAGSFTAGRILIGNGTGQFAVLAGTLDGQVATWNAALSEWVAQTPTSGVTSVTASSPLASTGGATPNISLSTVGVTNGGTGKTTLTSGAILLGNGTTAVNELVGTVIGQVPQWTGTTWSVGTITSGVSSFSAGTTGFTPATTTTGAITLAGILNLSNGGTGANSAVGARSNLGVTATGQDTTYAYRANNLSDLTSASTARTNLGLGSLATASSVSLTTQVTGTLPVANGGTGSTSLTGAGIVTTGDTQTISGVKTFSGGAAFTGGNYVVSQYLNFNLTGSSMYWDGSTVRIDVGFSNKFGVQTSVAYFTLSDVQKVGGGTFNSYSDRRFKQDITNYNRGLADLAQLNPVNYRYTAQFMQADQPSKPFVGLIAQDVQQTSFADCVTEDANGYRVLDTNQLTYALINAVQELSAEINSLKAEVAALKGAN